MSSRRGELGISEARYEDLLKSADEYYSRCLSTLPAPYVALDLALMIPVSITKQNIAAVYPGVLPNKRAQLGLLELLDNVKTLRGLLRWIEEGLKRTVETVSMTRVVNRFTRVTMGSSKELEKEKGLFGIILGEKKQGDTRGRDTMKSTRVRNNLTS